MSEMKPQRIQRKRTKGWRMPPNTVYVGRGSKWGNRYQVHDGNYEWAVRLFDRYLHETCEGDALRRQAEKELRGKNLACWCPLDKPCHADVLLKIANEECGDEDK